jgi:hypothetical protein
MTGSIAVTANERHMLAGGLDGSIKEAAFTEGGNSPFTRLRQIDFHVALITQVRPPNLAREHLKFLLADLPIALASENALKSLCEFGAYAPAARLRRLVLVAATNELDIVGKSLLVGPGDPAQRQQRCEHTNC